MKPPKINTSIRITDKLRADIKKAAYRSEMSQTAFIEQALERAVVLAGVKSIKQEGEK